MLEDPDDARTPARCLPRGRIARGRWPGRLRLRHHQRQGRAATTRCCWRRPRRPRAGSCWSTASRISLRDRGRQLRLSSSATPRTWSIRTARRGSWSSVLSPGRCGSSHEVPLELTTVKYDLYSRQQNDAALLSSRAASMLLPSPRQAREVVMINRRQFVQSGVAFSVVSVIARAVLITRRRVRGRWADSTARAFRVRQSLRVRCRRRAACCACRRAIPETSGDLTMLWYDRLDLEWRRAPAALAGVTTPTGVVRARDTRRRSRHARDLSRPAPSSRRRRGLAFGDGTGGIGCPTARDFARAGLRVATGRCDDACPIGSAAAQCEFTTPGERAVEYSEPLFSWIIAPASRRRAVV